MAKILTDWVKTVATLPKWSPPAIAFGSSFGLMLILLMALGVGLTMQLTAQAFILSIISTAVAIGSTALQARTNPSTDTVKSQADTDVLAQMQAANTADLIVQKVRESMTSNSAGDRDAHS